VIEVPKQTFHDCLMAAMTKSEAEEVAAALCEAVAPHHCHHDKNSENSKANRIETMKGPAESGEICSVEVEK
jgi:hypothetical protein